MEIHVFGVQKKILKNFFFYPNPGSAKIEHKKS